jgi:hypothetical protein
MADNAPPSPFKTKLGKSETSRLKTETSRQRKLAGDAAADKTVASVPPPPPLPPAPEPGSTAPIADPMARRDTSTGKLRRVQSPDETANALAPAGGEAEPKRTETVRLKVVRTPRAEMPSVGAERPAPTAPPPRPAGDTLAVPPPTATGGAGPRPGTATLKVQPPAPPQRTPPEVKRATATIKVEAPAGQQEKSAPSAAAPGQTPAAPSFSNTGTSTIKLQVTKPAQPPPAVAPAPALAAGKVATATLKIRPPGAPAATPSATTAVHMPAPAPAKEGTATLKIQKPVEAAPAPAPAAAPGPQGEPDLDVTATLKVRPGGAGAKPAPPPDLESGATVKIRPPSVPVTGRPTVTVSADDETHVGVQAVPPTATAPAAPTDKPRISLKLKKEDDGKAAKRDVVIPGLGAGTTPAQAETAEAARTVPVTPAAAEEEAEGAEVTATVPVTPADQTAAAGAKKGLRIKKPSKGKGDEAPAAATQPVVAPAAAAAPAAAPEAAATGAPEEEVAPRPAAAPAAGPGQLAAAAALLACAGGVALLVRLLLDLKRYL